MNMTKTSAAVRATALVLFSLLASCGPITYDLRITNQQISDCLAKRFPFTKTYLFIFDVTLSNPTVRLLEEVDRVRVSLDVKLNAKVRGEDSPLAGTFGVTTGLRFDNKTGSFFLSDLTIDTLSVSGMSSDIQPKVTQFMARVLAEYLARMPVYTLRATDVKTAIARLTLKNVRVTSGTLILSLGV
jgi:hypothetical protein